MSHNEGLPNPTQTRKPSGGRGWAVGKNPTRATPIVTTSPVVLQPVAPPAFVRTLLGRLSSLLLAAHLLRLEVLVEQEKSGLVGLGRAHDGEHALACLIMRSLLLWLAPPLFACQHKRRQQLTFAMEIRAPEVLRISLILEPARPMMQPTMSAGMLMFCVWISSPFSS